MEVLPRNHTNGITHDIDQLESSDPVLVLEHIARLIEANLGAARDQLEAVGNLLSQSEQSISLDRCSRFAGETQVALFAQKDLQQTQVNVLCSEDDAEH